MTVHKFVYHIYITRDLIEDYENFQIADIFAGIKIAELIRRRWERTQKRRAKYQRGKSRG